MPYATIPEKAYIAALNAGERDAEAQAERLEALELSPLADSLKALLTKAQDVLESRTAAQDEKNLAEKLLDACGPHDDCFLIAEVAGSVAQVKRVA